MNIVAACIIVSGLIYVGILLPARRLTPAGAVGFMVNVLAGALVVAVVVPNTSGITHLIVKAGNYFSMSADMQQAATQVQTDTAEVRQIKEQIQRLAKQISDANTRVSQSAQNVAQMEANVRQAYRALFDTLVVSLDTRSIFPPPQPAIDEMNRQLNILAFFAFPNPIEANAEWQRLHRVSALPLPTSTPKPN
jgi:hypothetical protein